MLFLVLSALAAPPAGAQDETGRPGSALVPLGTIRVNVRNATGAPLATHAIVSIRQRVGSLAWTDSTKDGVSAEFKNLPVGDYVVEVTSAGYHPATEEVTLFSANNVMQVFILLRAESAPSATIAAGMPVLSPKAQKEVESAKQALEANNLGQATEHLLRAEKMAPGHPEIQYLHGVVLARKGDLEGARRRFEKAVSIYPQHAPALNALGRLLLRAGDANGAVSAFERAVVADARAHESHAVLAQIFFEQKLLDKARYHAEQALDIAAGKLPETRLLLSLILVARGERQKAAEVLKQFLIAYPDHRDAAAAMRLHSTLVSGDRPAPLGPATPSSSHGSASVGGTAALPPEQDAILLAQAGTRLLSTAALTPELSPGAILPAPLEWAPKDIDQAPPAVFPDVPCAQADVLKRAGQRVADLIDNLGRVNAAEKVTHTPVDKQGRPGRALLGHYDYMFTFRRPRAGVIWVEEYRDGLLAKPMVGGVGHSGLAAMALVFHPAYSGDFEMKCEGQGSWNGEAVWYVRFQQRDDKPARMRSFTSQRGTARLRFKGRAWIAANSYQIVRLETDLIQPPKDLRFDREHLVIVYGPTKFKELKQTFWLPVSVDIYAQMYGRAWHRNHVLTNYIHFSVDTKQKIADPKSAESPEPKEARKPPQV